MLKILALLPLLAALGGPAAAADTSAAQFLRLGAGARALGMAGACAAVGEGAEAAYYNPASYAQASPRGELSLSHSWHVQDTGLTHGAYARRGWGASFTWFSAGDLEGRDDSGNPTGSFTAEDAALSAGAAFRWRGAAAGFSLKGIRQRIQERGATAAAADLGLLYPAEPDVPLRLGLSVSNLGSKIKFETEAYPLPVTWRAALAMRPGHGDTLLALQADVHNDGGSSLGVGAEVRPVAELALRGGYRTSSSEQRDAILGADLGDSASGMDGLYGFYMGLGFEIRGVMLDYALLPYGDLGSSHRFAVGMKFE